MREIKFREWDKKVKRMFVPDALKNPVNNFTKNIEHMEFTGLHDKNGKEIYEGDIVVGAHGVYRAVATEVKPTSVDWDDNGLRFVLFGYYGHELSDFLELEIIGNIYENPELLLK